MGIEDVLSDLKTKIRDKLPKGVTISDLEFEGPELVVYTTDPKAFADNGDIIRSLAKDLRMRIVVRPDPKMLAEPEEAVRKIAEIVPAESGVTNHYFDTETGEVIIEAEKPEVGIIAYGTSHWAIEEGLDQLRREQNIDAGYCRLRAYPFTREVHDFIHRYERVYVVDQNRDAQMLGLLRLESSAEEIAKLRSVRHYDGSSIDARSITDQIVFQEAAQ